MNKLTPYQISCSARIFLNILGFTLEEKDNLLLSDKLKIYDKDNNEVGKYYIDNDNVEISLNYEQNNLIASYKIPDAICMLDPDDDLLAKFADWVSLIEFHYYLSNGSKLQGYFNLRSWVDSVRGIRCTGHVDMNYITLDDKKIIFKIFNNGTLFYVNVTSNNINEEFDILIDYNEFLGYTIFHQKRELEKDDWKYYSFSKITEYDNEPGYKRLMAGEIDNSEGKKETKNYINNKLEKDKNMNHSEELLENISLIKTVDKEMFEKINKLCESFKIGNELVLKNFVCACFDSYDDKVFEEIFGFKRNRLFYQNKANSLTESYYEIDSEKNIDTIKRFIKNIEENE